MDLVPENQPPAAKPRSLFVHTADVITEKHIRHEMRRHESEPPTRIVVGYWPVEGMEDLGVRVERNRPKPAVITFQEPPIPVVVSEHVGRYSFRLEWDS